MKDDTLTQRVIGCCFTVHSQLGPGFPEKIYHKALERVLGTSGIAFASEKKFQGATVGSFKVDLLIEERVVVEVKAVTGPLAKIFEAQVVAYLKAARLPVGLLVNFGNASCQVRRLELSSR